MINKTKGKWKCIGQENGREWLGKGDKVYGEVGDEEKLDGERSGREKVKLGGRRSERRRNK